MKDKAPIVKQMYRLTVEPRVGDQLSKLAARTGKPKTRPATRLFNEACLGFKPAAKAQAARARGTCTAPPPGCGTLTRGASNSQGG